MNQPVHLLNETHDPANTSWVESANTGATDFPIQNLPFGVFARSAGPSACGVAIGDMVLDLRVAAKAGLLDGLAPATVAAVGADRLNALMELSRAANSELRARISDILDSKSARGSAAKAAVKDILVAQDAVEMKLPAAIGSFSDFLVSEDHVKRQLRGRGPTAHLEIMKHYPPAYSGRASSISVSGTPVRRPNGQWQAGGAVTFGPSQALDFELELGLFVGRSTDLGEPVPIRDAEQHFFGFALLNDWTARDLQGWESLLGPFLGKSFSSTIAPWVVTAEAMAPFRAPMPPRAPEDPAVLPYLHATDDQGAGLLDLDVFAYLTTPKMRAASQPPLRLTASNTSHMGWTFAQILAHQTSNGCNITAGDVLGSGTLSGPAEEAQACFSELSTRGTQTFTLPNGETRLWLEDGDEILLQARASRAGFASIGFGDCSATIAPAVSV